MAGARYEPVKLESQKCSIALTAALMGGTARQHQECLQLRAATRFVTSGLISQAFGSISKRHRVASRQPLAV
jgi:hypothetical protein